MELASFCHFPDRFLTTDREVWGKNRAFVSQGFGFWTFCGPCPSHDSSSYLNRRRITQYMATKFPNRSLRNDHSVLVSNGTCNPTARIKIIRCRAYSSCLSVLTLFFQMRPIPGDLSLNIAPPINLLPGSRFRDASWSFSSPFSVDFQLRDSKSTRK